MIEYADNNCRTRAIAVLVGFCILMMLLRCGNSLADDHKSGRDGLSRAEELKLGERIYRDGILPSGEPVKAVVQGDIIFEGTQFCCSNCHMRGGLGANEGQVKTPPANGKRLFQPAYSGGRAELSKAEWDKIPRQHRSAILRPAYTDKSLADLIRGGVDPTGRVLDPIMPRYQLDDRNMAILIAYLKVLSSTPSPGVTDTTIRFATVIAGEVSPEDRDAMLIPLESYITDRNNQAKPFESRRKNYGWGAENMDLEFRRLTLSRWELKGPPETWRAQLEEYYRKEPVFALLGGISYGSWKPVHEFSEDHRIPCILPIVDYPVITESDWYTLYFSKGYYQEGEAVANYLADTMKSQPDRAVVQIVQEGRAARTTAEGFEKTWQRLAMPAPVLRTIKPGEPISREIVHQLGSYDKPPILLLFAGPETLPSLKSIFSDPKHPEMVVIFSSLMKQSIMELPASIRDLTYITYPYRLPQEEGQYSNFAKAWLYSRKAPINDHRISTRMYSLISLMAQTFMHLRRNYYRDNLLDAISMFPDQVYPDYERLSFGPGQVYASKGCYIVQLSPGANPHLVKKSDWTIQ